MNKDRYIIESADDYNEVRKMLSRKQKPARVMCMLMNALEAYRQKRKLGWSRPWNKYNLNVFQSFKLKTDRDTELLALAENLLASDIPMPDTARRFANELLADKEALMGFIFVHDYCPEGECFEGATLSLGRIHNKKFRDRIDLILESRVEQNQSSGFSRMRVYIDPFTGIKEPLWSSVVDKQFSPGMIELFSQLSDASWQWAQSAEHLWDHWTSNYIDYFGERESQLERAYFYLDGKPDSARQFEKTDQAA